MDKEGFVTPVVGYSVYPSLPPSMQEAGTSGGQGDVVLAVVITLPGTPPCTPLTPWQVLAENQVAMQLAYLGEEQVEVSTTSTVLTPHVHPTYPFTSAGSGRGPGGHAACLPGQGAGGAVEHPLNSANPSCIIFPLSRF